MRQSILLWGLALGTFVVTLGISSWHDEPSDGAAAVNAVTSITPASSQARPFAPVTAAPQPVATPPLTPAAVTAPPPSALPKVEPISDPAPELVSNPEPQSEPLTTPDVDNGEMLARQDRAALRSARAR